MKKVVLPARNFSLGHTLASGQVFRWQTLDDGYLGLLGRSVVHVRQAGERLECETRDSAVTPERLRHYFALDHDLPAILRTVDVDPQIHEALQSFAGLRVIRQEPWECLASFICSSFNNIKRLQGMIERLCRRFGRVTPTGDAGARWWTFPEPTAIARASERTLRELGLGFRAPYLKAAARLVADGRLDAARLRRQPYEQAKQRLQTVPGVGDKVADCIALFALQQYEAFPIDVWTERILKRYVHRQPTRARLHRFARRHFGAYAGYAQQYLYHQVRQPGVSLDNLLQLC
ncbi:MAG: 8-oxoguanine DNA glycosylase [Candidatus Omnitrophica bacterium]|nr:8-oxoguanine DNA glycosylase [Candidatus Omnitrophota bacterium]